MRAKQTLALAGALCVMAPAAFAQDRWTVFAGGSTNPILGQRQSLGFADHAAGGVSYARKTDRLSLDLTLSAEDDGEGLRLDHSFAEARVGEFAFGVGAVDRQWSPSRFNSLILSDNARPFASAYIRKDGFSRFDTPLLSWLGPWSGEVFLGRTEAEGEEDVNLLGMRFQLQPTPGLEIDLVRVAQYGAGSSSLSDALGGGSNEGAGSDANQLAGLGLSYALPDSVAPLRLYVQAIGEDEAGGLPSCFMYLGGIEGKGQVWGVPTTVTLEGATTEISDTENGNCGPGTAYTNGSYPAGYTHHGDVMGLPLDTDGRMVQLQVEHALPQVAVHWSVGWHDINVTGRDDHRLSSTAVDGAVARVGATKSWNGLSVTGDVLYQSYDLDRADADRGLGVALRVARTF
ncbi:capsule assembly Wzi family protein [Falsirhodobacter sp. 20TX0035]|uniref:capsule assembly Wzi family protein n=1 Tax=Falsirhodobacter sp. 20TX0035 TaxID=3022019 RepID=UPI00232DD3B5|nr:capsule assembly Wzi family protein [Falsirhodobacter sp. 20TX0035]MDB6452678.1 capsule assembly Wzi family protein [Falsirhodobacter sp. 20TX0035]